MRLGCTQGNRDVSVSSDIHMGDAPLDFFFFLQVFAVKLKNSSPNPFIKCFIEILTPPNQ